MSKKLLSKSTLIINTLLVCMVIGFLSMAIFYRKNKNVTPKMIPISLETITVSPMPTVNVPTMTKTMSLASIEPMKESMLEPDVKEIVVEETDNQDSCNPDSYGMTEDELNLLYAVVQQEGGPYYESAEAVMSTIVNRVNNLDKWSWAGDTIIEQITYPQQYCYSLDDLWVQYVGNADEDVIRAVNDVLKYGPVHDYDCFRGYYIEDAEQIYDNWYFIG